MSQSTKKQSVTYITVQSDNIAQRIDNFLFSIYKHLPKSYIYRIIRTGEVRVNSARIKPSYKLLANDSIRIPPVTQTTTIAPKISDADADFIMHQIIYEDTELLVVNKPAHLAVHSGTSNNYGLIDLLRHCYPEDNVHLAHRLDKNTSGCLIATKTQTAQRAIQALFRKGLVTKTYQALVVGHWNKPRRVSLPLAKDKQKQTVSAGGKQATTEFDTIQNLKNYTLMSVLLKTGRTHQIRVHAAHCGHPIAGDKKYGNFADNRALAKLGLNCLFLHAHCLAFDWHDKKVSFETPLPNNLQKILSQLTTTK